MQILYHRQIKKSHEREAFVAFLFRLNPEGSYGNRFSDFRSDLCAAYLKNTEAYQDMLRDFSGMMRANVR